MAVIGRGALELASTPACWRTRTSTTGSAVLALDLDRPIGKLRDLVLTNRLTHRLHDLPVTELAGLRHRLELETPSR